MADVIVDPIAPEQVNLVVGLYNQLFRPHKDRSSFEHRYHGRPQLLQLVARRHDRPVGFLVAYETEPQVLWVWLLGVLPDDRRQGIASQLLEAAESWAGETGYEWLRGECLNTQRAALALLIARGFDIVGLRWDAEQLENQILFQKPLR
ncbi:MAG: GNAT family N-acetyltransferase [Gemmataceae bacterium]